MGNQKISRRALGGKNNHPRFTARFGPVAVILALFIGLVSFLIFSGYTPIAPTETAALDTDPRLRDVRDPVVSIVSTAMRDTGTPKVRVAERAAGAGR